LTELLKNNNVSVFFWDSNIQSRDLCRYSTANLAVRHPQGSDCFVCVVEMTYVV